MTCGDKIWSFRTPLPFRHSRVRWHAETKFGHSAPMIRGDTLWLFAPFCHPEAAGPMTSRDQVWSFCTLVSSRGGGPDDTRRYLTVIRTLLSSRGGGPDDMRRQIMVIPHPFAIQTQSCPMARRDQVWSFCTHDTRRYLTVICTPLLGRHSCVRWQAETKSGHSAHMIRGDTLRLSAPLCHSDTFVSDGTQRPSLVILHP